MTPGHGLSCYASPFGAVSLIPSPGVGYWRSHISYVFPLRIVPVPSRVFPELVTIPWCRVCTSTRTRGGVHDSSG